MASTYTPKLSLITLSKIPNFQKMFPKLLKNSLYFIQKPEDFFVGNFSDLPRLQRLIQRQSADSGALEPKHPAAAGTPRVGLVPTPS